MKKLAMLLPAALLFAACSDIPSEPPVAGPSFDNPPPPKLSGTGFVAFGAQLTALSPIIQSHSCEDLGDLAVAFVIDGNYFQNPPGTHAWVNFTPDGGTGQAWIREHGTGTPLPVPPDPNDPQHWVTLEAGGSVKYNVGAVDGVGGIDYQVHLLSYRGTPLRRPEGVDGGDAAGAIAGVLTAEVRACGRSEPEEFGVINFDWPIEEDDDDCVECVE